MAIQNKLLPNSYNLMNNPVLEFLLSLKGQTLENSPSPLSVWLHGKLTDVSLGKATIEYIIRKEMTNPLGTLQGGMYAAMMDDTLGVAVYSLGKDKFYTTVNFYVDYLESAVEGDAIFVNAEVIRQGNTMVNVEMKATNLNGKLIAKGNSNLVSKTVEGIILPRFEGFEKKYPGYNFQNNS